MGATEMLSSYAAKLKYEDLPEAVVAQAKLILMDLIGCIISGVPLSIGTSIIKQAKDIGGGIAESRIIGTKEKVSCVAAAYANGALSDGTDWNDMLYVGHPATAAVSSALSIGEKYNSSGKEIIEAIVAAYEVFGRIGICVQPTEERQRALWGMLTWIPFNSAIATGKLLKLNESQMATALGAAAAYAPLGACSKYVETRSDVYHYSHGMASMAGVLSALNTKNGLTGMNTILEGPNGFWVMAGSDQCDFDRLNKLIATLGKDFWVLKTLFKRWPANLWVQSYLDILDDLVNKYGIEANEIMEINYSPALPMLSTYKERGAMDAAFSISYMLSVYMFENKPGSTWYSDLNLHKKEVIDLVKKVKKREGAMDADLGHEFNNYWNGDWMPTQVEVKTKSDRSFMGYETYPKGHPSNPMDSSEMKEKFKFATRDVLKPQKVEKIITVIDQLENVTNISQLTDMLY
jgi:2-methylcitrate dehydratase PrpD